MQDIMAPDHAPNTKLRVFKLGWLLIPICLLAFGSVRPAPARVGGPMHPGDPHGGEGTPYEEPEYMPVTLSVSGAHSPHAVTASPGARNPAGNQSQQLPEGKVAGLEVSTLMWVVQFLAAVRPF